jgi:hypothetical protein
VRVFRLVTAFLIAPWIPVVGYYGYYVALWSSRGVETPSVSAFVAVLAPGAYVATLVWLPFVLVLRRFGKHRLLPLAAGGTVLGALIGVAALAAGGQEIFSASTAHFLAAATALGLLFGVGFWAIALAGTGKGTEP